MVHLFYHLSLIYLSNDIFENRYLKAFEINFGAFSVIVEIHVKKIIGLVSQIHLPRGIKEK